MLRPNLETMLLLACGGPAPGANAVIAGAALAARAFGVMLLGAKGGLADLLDRGGSALVPIDLVRAKKLLRKGGSWLHFSRVAPARLVPARVRQALRERKVRAVVLIGGEGTASLVLWFQKNLPEFPVIMAPKTVDLDLALPSGIPTFGFATARARGAELVASLLTDARSCDRWYVVIAQGRDSGHLPLGIATAAGANQALIREQFAAGLPSIEYLADRIAGSVLKSRWLGELSGVAVVAEGLAPPGVEPSACGLGKQCCEAASGVLRELGLDVKVLPKDLGYELRGQEPVAFDVEYARNLGFAAVEALLDGHTGVVVAFEQGQRVIIPLSRLLDASGERMQRRPVQLESCAAKIAFQSMTELTAQDLDDPERLAALSSLTNLGPEAFRRRFESVVERTR